MKGHSAELGCSKCKKRFPGSFGEKRDYSGFDRDNWVRRTNADHRRSAEKLRKIKTQSKIVKLSKEVGINYYSALLDLEYFGTAKRVFKLWVSKGHLSKQQLKQIEERLAKMEVPPEMGRLPKNISSNHGSYTAELEELDISLLYVCTERYTASRTFKMLASICVGMRLSLQTSAQ